MNPCKTSCVVLCGGKGSRAYPLTLKKQKTMITVYERPILQYIIDYWSAFASHFIFVVKYKKEEIIQYVSSLSIHASFAEPDELRGIANGLLCTEKLVREQFIVVLGDCLCKGSFQLSPTFETGVGVYETNCPDDIQRSYSVEISEGKIFRVVEKPKLLPNKLCGMGYYFLDHDVFDYIIKTPTSPLRNEIEITDVLQKMIEDGKILKPFTFTGDYLNLTFPEDYNRALEIFKDEKSLGRN
ncbi:MAG: NTP transferase domain-containing protein [Candidatus Kuenenia sp.]|nr:NTP transferase domain-containing protein [Candidatus Kuenenia hertensis]